MVKRSSEEKSKEKSSSNLKLISTTSGVRVSQACDRCRIKKIKCDGLTPCHNCSKIGFDCKTSDKLTRRAFPKGYTENLENRVKELEEELKSVRDSYGISDATTTSHPDSQTAKTGAGNSAIVFNNEIRHDTPSSITYANAKIPSVESNTPLKQVIINNPIDQIFNLDRKGVIIGNDNLNFESQFNHLLINLNLPFLKISNSHNYLLNDPDSYLYHPLYTLYNQFHNKDLDVIYNPLTSNNASHDDYTQGVSSLTNSELPKDIYDLFIKLINNFKKIFNNKKELDSQVTQFFLNYNVFIPIFDYKLFMESYDNFHTMYPFMFTYDDATINGFNILNNDYHVVNEYLMVVIQIYAMIMMNNPTINLNLLLNHPSPHYVFEAKSDPKSKNIIRSLYDFLPYFNVFHVSITQLQTYLLFLYFSLLTNNKEKSLVLSALVNAFIGILGINLNSKNLFFNDLSLNQQQKASRVKIFWVFKVLLKCFNLKFGFKPSLNTTVINPVTIDRYFELTPEKLSALLDDPSMSDSDDHHVNDLFKTLLKPSVEFLNLVNIIIPSSFSPNYYQYLKNDHHQDNQTPKRHPKNLDWILNDDDGDGNDGNLNYNLTQFVTIDKNLSNWRASLKEKKIKLAPFQYKMNLPAFASSPAAEMDLFHSIKLSKLSDLDAFGISPQGMNNFLNNGVPDPETAGLLIKIQLNFHYLLIRSMNYLNFIIDKELSNNYYVKINNISKELLCYFILIFRHVALSYEVRSVESSNPKNGFLHHNPHSTGTNPAIMDSLGLDVDEDGFVINDFSARRRRTSLLAHNNPLLKVKQFPASPFNFMLNGLSMTIINFKKSLLMQMLYLLICSIKFFKKTHTIENDVVEIITASVDLFIKIFINYELNSSNKKVGHTSNKMSKLKQDELFKKLMNDELKDQILREPRNEEDDYVDVELEQNYFTEFSELTDIDWDDEDMDEDFKYLKILKFIKYKINQLKEISKRRLLSKSSSQTGSTLAAQESSNDRANSKMPSLASGKPTSNYYTPKQSGPALTLQALPKMPLTSKLDYLLQGDSLPSHTLSNPTLGRSNAKFSLDTARSDDLIKKEKLVINDLMSLKHGHTSLTNTYVNQNWLYNNESPT